MNEQEGPPAEHRSHRRRRWSRRRGLMGIRNGRLLALAIVALACGVAVTLLSAYLGIR